MMNRNTVKYIYCIDGVDGCGKGTISAMIKERLRDMGRSVAVISPPFYDTPSGKIVKDYLTTGVGDIQDRNIISMLYSFDRNMYFREHFNEIFQSGKYDTVLYNRNWLSSVFFQTTMICQTPEDTKRFNDARFTFCENNDPKTKPMEFQLSMPIMHDMIHPQMPLLDDETCKTLGQYPENIYDYSSMLEREVTAVYNRYRALLVRNMIQSIYSMEIAPWHVATSARLSENPFTNGRDIRNIVLCPKLDPNSMQVVHDNLMKRYEGDESKFDRNERNYRYLLAVTENINWIKSNWYKIIGKIPFSAVGVVKDVDDSHELIGCGNVFPKLDALDECIYKPFVYDIVCTTPINRTDAHQQRNIEDIANDVFARLTAGELLDATSSPSPVMLKHDYYTNGGLSNT